MARVSFGDTCRYLDLVTDPQTVDQRPDLLKQRWYVHPDDLIGGWAVMNVDKPPSQADYRLYEVSVADFLTEEAARHMVELHNATLGAE